ncbi:hypothetical protein MXEN_05250 [Mycobacterium xenopi RIVM700367]|uniref:hypothetical protein n=1 Tax=Mycobacterium xenopi TaxID=1789 RepID=UPI00025AD122|nr:hypothetical protein [Mycobacterium xenopi]EID15855.1 hypothetical protein MXEN_05250 [Mycobacterium xenopi RIVM700367]
MLIIGLVCVCAAVAAAAFGLRSVSRPDTLAAAGVPARALAPIQGAAAVLLGSGGAVALAAPNRALVIVIMCVVGAVCTVAAGSWRAARYALRGRRVLDCAGNCSGCPQLDRANR